MKMTESHAILNCSNTSDTQHGRRNGKVHSKFDISQDECEEISTTSTGLRHSLLECTDGSSSGRGGGIGRGVGMEQDAVEENEENRENSFST
jgi:peptidoglycan hydrolase-like amidase